MLAKLFDDGIMTGLNDVCERPRHADTRCRKDVLVERDPDREAQRVREHRGDEHRVRRAQQDADRLLEVLCLVKAPEAGPLLLEFQLQSKVPKRAADWLDQQVGPERALLRCGRLLPPRQPRLSRRTSVPGPLPQLWPPLQKSGLRWALQ